VITRYPTVIYGLKVKKHKPQSGIKDKSRTTSEKFDLNIWNRPRVNSKILKKLVCFLPCGKAEYTAYPSLPRVCGSTLQLRPRTPCRSEAEIPLAGDLPAKPGSKEQHPRLLQRWGELLRESLEEKIREAGGYNKAKRRQLKLLKRGLNIGTSGYIELA